MKPAPIGSFIRDNLTERGCHLCGLFSAALKNLRDDQILCPLCSRREQVVTDAIHKRKESTPLQTTYWPTRQLDALHEERLTCAKPPQQLQVQLEDEDPRLR